MKRKPPHEMTVAECQEALSRAKRAPYCLPQDVEYWQWYIDFHSNGRDMRAANRLAEERKTPSKPRVRIKAGSHAAAPATEPTNASEAA